MLQKFLNYPTRMTARTVLAYRNTQHDVRLIVTTVARRFSPLTGKCGGFHCQTIRKIHVRYENSNQLQRRDSVHLSSVYTDCSLSKDMF